MESKVYIHYGHSEFRKDLFTPIRNIYMFVKPTGGLWASPLFAEWGWKDWCTQEHFRVDQLEKYFKFTLSEDAKVLHIYSVEQLEELPQTDGMPMWCCLDFELLTYEYDAIELHLSEESRRGGFMDGLYWQLYGWDCDSILIMNPDVVIPIKEGGLV